MPPEAERSPEPVRRLTAADLDVAVASAIRTHGSSFPDDPPLADDDPHYLKVLDLIDVYGGVIFRGPPGTSKTWYAGKIASRLAGEQEWRLRFVQFHASYQYEDFMQGYVPKANGSGFELVDKCFVDMCRRAEEAPEKLFVLVIDELSRADPGRVFGEALTYIERSKREQPFSLLSGETFQVPKNVFVIATMNPLDRGVDEVDGAFERRFAKIAMEPDVEILEERLKVNGVAEQLRRRILAFFRKANSDAELNPLTAVGHTFFWNVTDEASLRSLWDHHLRFTIERAHRLDIDTRRELERGFRRILEPLDEEPSLSEGEELD
jgi:5-methylcytosine-specific restriction protein B